VQYDTTANNKLSLKF